jgi:hypothetical protein
MDPELWLRTLIRRRHGDGYWGRNEKAAEHEPPEIGLRGRHAFNSGTRSRTCKRTMTLKL